MAGDPHILFIAGAPRSGTTTLLDFMTVMKACGWIPENLAKDPGHLARAAQVRRQHWPLLGDFWLERRYAWKRVAAPAEGEAFWNYYLPGFTPDVHRPVDPDTLSFSGEQIRRCREAVFSVAHRQGASLFVGHYTGFPRVRLLRRVFPEARFIQMLRDPRSVAYHLVRKVEGGNHPLWRHREAWRAIMPEPLQRRLDELDDTPLNFNGVKIRWLHQRYSEAFAELPESDWMEVAYADLMAYPQKTLQRVLDYAGLSSDQRFRYYLKYHQIHQSNQRTKRNISDEESEQLDRAVSPLP